MDDKKSVFKVVLVAKKREFEEEITGMLDEGWQLVNAEYSGDSGEYTYRAYLTRLLDDDFERDLYHR
jgi:hypothetical protein